MTDYLAPEIIPAKDVAVFIQPCVNQLKIQKGYRFNDQYEEIMVDDGSPDDTANIAEACGIKVIRQLNKGPAASRNIGVRNAKGNIILFTDADCIPTSNWISQMLKPFKDAEVVGVKGAYCCKEKNPVARVVQQEFEYNCQLSA